MHSRIMPCARDSLPRFSAGRVMIIMTILVEQLQNLVVGSLVGHHAAQGIGSLEIGRAHV